jgi:hypothetical protein
MYREALILFSVGHCSLNLHSFIDYLLEMTTASTYLDDPRFNREFILPACQAHQAGSPLCITYADYGYNGEDGNTFMFFGPLLGSRLLHISQDSIAKKHKIRVLAVDRPGIGGTESVKLDCRMLIWRGELDRILHTMLTVNNWM